VIVSLDSASVAVMPPLREINRPLKKINASTAVSPNFIDTGVTNPARSI
jgi:hypothetical protein